MKKILFVLLLIFACSPTEPVTEIETDPKPQVANIYGEFAIYSYLTIKWGGFTDLNYASDLMTCNLTNGHIDGTRRVYDFMFENVDIIEGSTANFVVQLKNGFGGSSVYKDTSFVLVAGDINFRLTYLGTSKLLD